MEAIILAGGKGTRLRSIIGEYPKPMAKINGKPFLEKQLEWLFSQGVKHVIMSVGYKASIIQDYFGNNFKTIEITYVIENSPLGTGGAIKLASEKTRNDNFFILNGDTYYPINLLKMKESLLRRKMLVAIKKMKYISRYGVLSIDGDKIISFKEKASCPEGNINSGIYYCSRGFIDDLPLEVFSFEVFLEQHIDALDLYCYAPSEDNLFIDIGVPQDFEKAQKLIL